MQPPDKDQPEARRNAGATPELADEGTKIDPAIAVGRARAGISLRNLKTFSSFKNRAYRLYYGALLGQMASINMQMMTRSLLVYRLTGSASTLGVVALALAVPTLVFSLFGGVIADRVQKKFVLIVGQASSATVSLGIALSLTLGYLSADRAGSWWILVAASLLQGTIMGLMMPSRQAIIAEVVDEKQLMNAVALNTLGMNSLRLVAPAIAGFLIDGFGFAAIYYTMTAMYLMAVIFIAFMPLTSRMAIRGQGALADLKDGLKYVRKESAILLILVFILFSSLVSMPYQNLMPIFVDDILKVGATGMGVLFSVSGIGAMAGSLTLASIPSKKRGFILLFSGLILGLAVLGFAFSRSWYLSLALIVFIGLGQAARMTVGNSLLQYYVTDEYRGRVMSLYMMNFGLTSFGVFFAAVMADSIGVQWSLGSLAIMLLIVSILALALVPRIRNLN